MELMVPDMEPAHPVSESDVAEPVVHPRHKHHAGCPRCASDCSCVTSSCPSEGGAVSDGESTEGGSVGPVESEDSSFLKAFSEAFAKSAWKQICPNISAESLLQQIGVEVPSAPGDIVLCGDMHESVVQLVASSCRSWIYMNPPGDPSFHREVLQDSGVILEFRPFMGLPSDVAVSSLLQALDSLPRPVMLQCTSGSRAGAAFLLWMSLRRGLNKNSADELATKLKLQFYADPEKRSLAEWVLGQLPDEA